VAAAEAAANKVVAVAVVLFYIQSKRQFHQGLIRLLLDKVALVRHLESATPVREPMELTLLLLDTLLAVEVQVAVVVTQVFNQQPMVTQDLAVVRLALLQEQRV
jgi:hypothetical protein